MYNNLYSYSESEPGPRGYPGPIGLTGQVVGICLVQTILPNSVLSVCNPLGEPIALTAGVTNPVSAHLVITRLA